MGQNKRLDAKLLRYVAKEDYPNMFDIHKLVARGADPLARDEQGRTMMHLAVGKNSLGEGQREIIAFCINKGMDINTRDNDGLTVLHTAARNFRSYSSGSGIADLVNRYGANINARTTDGWTPLHYAAGHENGAIHELLPIGADPRAVDNNGATPLHIAAQCATNEDVGRLLNRGADARSKTNAGLTPADFAVQGRRYERALDLQKKAADAEAWEKAKAAAPAMAETPKPVAAAPVPVPVVEDAWKRLDDDCIAFTAERKTIGYRITEIFNFSSRVYTQITHNTATQAEAVAVRTFDEFADKSLIERAFTELQQRGGKADAQSVNGPSLDKSFKAPRPPEI